MHWIGQSSLSDEAGAARHVLRGAGLESLQGTPGNLTSKSIHGDHPRACSVFKRFHAQRVWELCRKEPSSSICNAGETDQEALQFV